MSSESQGTGPECIVGAYSTILVVPEASDADG